MKIWSVANGAFAGTVGTQVVKVFDKVMGRTGLRQDEALASGFDPITVEGSFVDHKAYYPGASPVTVRITAERHTGRLLGAQMIGEFGAEISKRIDILAAALFCDLTVEELNDLDLSYTPPLASPWDVVQLAGQTWQQATHRKESL